MIPVQGCRATAAASIPRESGDDPNVVQVCDAEAVYSPRERG